MAHTTCAFRAPAAPVCVRPRPKQRVAFVAAELQAGAPASANSRRLNTLQLLCCSAAAQRLEEVCTVAEQSGTAPAGEPAPHRALRPRRAVLLGGAAAAFAVCCTSVPAAQGKRATTPAVYITMGLLS